MKPEGLRIMIRESDLKPFRVCMKLTVAYVYGSRQSRYRMALVRNSPALRTMSQMVMVTGAGRLLGGVVVSMTEKTA
jgi:hypothetical protein